MRVFGMLFAASLALAFSVAAAPPAPPGVHPEATPRQAGRRMRFDPAAGYVTRVTQEGLKMVFLDLRGGDSSDLYPEVSRMQQNFETSIDVRTAPAEEGVDASRAAFATLAEDGVGAVVALADMGDSAPTLSVFPEDRVAVLNVARLRRSLPDGAEAARAALAARLRKELWRASAFALGGYENEHPCVMKGVFSIEDLDADKVEMACPPVWGRVAAHARRLGFARSQTAPYFMALRQGWAPAPTNDAQRAEYERHKMAMERKAASDAAAASAPAATTVAQ